MRKSAFPCAFLASLLLSAVAGADDFSALLADLSFGDDSVATETLTATEPPDQAQLQAAPTGITMPTEITMPELALPEAETPQVALQDPVPVDVPEVADQVDLDAAFALQDAGPAVTAQAVGHVCGQQNRHHCDEELVCTPHLPPNLPSSTFYQYFRSNKCNTHVWDGYRQRCRHSNSHINGTCDCFKERDCDCGEVLDPCDVQCNDCNVRPHRRLMPARPSCEAPAACDTGCAN